MWRWVCALVLLCTVIIKADTLKREEMSAAPFVLGSRYGRSSPRVMSPRNDSRYGKRSEPVAVHWEHWRPRCHCPCPPYSPPAPDRTLYKRRPEFTDGVPEQD